ncbi:MAG: hypothetical protein LQ348_002484 [Seirophora lacunosa]|nr:MAG: hypothetical protein LQ348_002484 [Seirophora lacunosa]
MSVRVALNDQRPWYTNLDVIAGKAILSLPRRETVTAITVKLEGECKTRLVGEIPVAIGVMGRRTRDEVVETEVHKVLYKVSTLFPTNDILLATASGGLTLEAGLHEFPFQLKLPFNNSCVDADSTYVALAGLQVHTQGNRDRHVRKTLPPSLHVFQDQAFIRYYVKATVQRPAFYKENFRSEVSFQFFPIEPPRPPAPSPEQPRSESYARIAHAFAPTAGPPPTAKSRGLFGEKPAVPGPDVSSLLPPNICIDGRLPDPAIITCNQPLPLKVMITKLNDSSAALYLQLLQIELVAKTRVRAHYLLRDNLTSTVIISKSNMRTRLPENDKTMQIDKGYWSTIHLPNNVAPTFDTCNISRSYELRIKVGLQHGVDDHVFPELVVKTIIMPVQVFSGIAPPQALLQAMASHSPPPKPPRPHVMSSGPHVTSSTATANLSPHPLNAAAAAAPPPPPSPVPQQFQTGQTHLEGPTYAELPTHPEGPFPDEAPPSYEEALADGIAPVDGPRGVYSQGQEGGSGGNTLGEGGKAG